MNGLIDAYGAPEFFVTGVHRERVCSDLVKLVFFAEEDGRNIVRVKLLMPLAHLVVEQRHLSRFMSDITAPRLVK